MVLVKKKGNFYRAVIKLLGILFLLFIGSRQHAPAFSGLPVPMLAPCSPQGLITSSGHANMVRIFQVCRCPCWRRPPREALILRRAAPTRPGFPRPAGAHVGVDLLAKPLSFAEPRQHALGFSNLPASLLAPTSPQSLYPSSSHANTPRLFRFAGAHVGVDLPAKPLPFVGSRQHAPAFPDLPAPMLASTLSQSLCPSSVHANTQKHRPKSMQYKTRGKRLYRFPLVLFLQKFVRAEIIQR